jgi:CBS domain
VYYCRAEACIARIRRGTLMQAFVALLIAGGVFGIGLGLAVWNSRWKFADNATFIALFLTPLLVYGIASGMVGEFTAPGGWGAKFREAAQANVVVTATSLTPLSEAVQKFELVSKGGLAELEGLGAKLQRNKPIALTFQLGQLGYNVDTARKYVEFLLLTDPQMSVLILDQGRRFVAMTEGTTMLTMLKDPNQGQQIIDAISSGRAGYLLGLPGLHVNTVKANDSNATALERMRVENVQSIVVVDDDKRPAGIVKRDDIVARLLEKLATPDR